MLFSSHLRVFLDQKTPGNFQEPGTDSAVSVCSRLPFSQLLILILEKNLTMLLSFHLKERCREENAELRLSVRMRRGKLMRRRGGEKGVLEEKTRWEIQIQIQKVQIQKVKIQKVKIQKKQIQIQKVKIQKIQIQKALAGKTRCLPLAVLDWCWPCRMSPFKSHCKCNSVIGVYCWPQLIGVDQLSTTQVHYSKTLTEHDIKHIERHLSMKRTIRKKIMRDLQQAFVQVILS